MRRWLHKKCSLQTQIITYVLALVIGMTLLLNSFYIYQMRRTIEKDAHIYAYEIVKQLGRSVESYIQHMNDILWIIVNQEENLLNKLKENLNQPSVRKSKLLEDLRVRDSNISNIVAINIFGSNGLILTDGPSNQVKDYIDVTQMAWYQAAVEAKGKPVVSSSHTQNYLRDDGRWVFSVSAAVIENNELLGVVLIDMSYKVLTDMCNEIRLGEQGYIYIISEDSDIIYHPKQQLVYSGLVKEDTDTIIALGEGSFSEKVEANRLVTVHTVGEVGWIVVGVSYIGELLVSTAEILIPIIIFTVLCILGCYVISKRMAGRISKPILQLEERMQEVQAGNLEGEIQVEVTTAELASLAQSFKEMVSRIQTLIEDAKEHQRKLRKSELTILNSQINPHFLYNSLDTIIWLGEREECEKVVRTTAALARYFRLSLSKGKEVITIYEEIQHIKHYLEIQKIRYANKLSYSIDVAPEILGYQTIKITLQPLVENALYHGIRDKDEGGWIKVKAFKEGQNIVFEVYDDGKGMSMEQIKTIFTAPVSTSITKGGVAIKNVQERIQIYFGSDYGLSYTSQVGQFTCARVVIPAIEVEEYEE